MRVFRTSLLALAVVVACSQEGRAAETTILGTGSAFAQPIYSRWASEEAKETGVHLNYQPSGSGIGQNQVLKGLTDFGASDVPMDDDKLRQGDILQFPTVAGGYAVVVNLPGVRSNELRLTADALADIFMGNIRRWDDPRITSLNPGLELPKMEIALLYHAGGSGGTYALSRYLSKASEAWRKRMGVGLTLDWPVGAGVKGSFGAATTTPVTAGSIAYAEFSYAVANHLTTIQLRNKAGRFVPPSGETFAAAVESADWKSASHFAVDLTDTPGEQSWPIVTPTFVLVPMGSHKAGTSDAVMKFFSWAFAHGDDAARSLQYVPLPAPIKAEIMTTLGK